MLLNGVGINITVLSYQDRLDFGIVGDRELVPDLVDVPQGLREDLAELEAVAAAHV